VNSSSRSPIYFNKRALATQALKAAMTVRSKGGLDQYSPACVYDLCERLGVTVRFVNINMEGMYEKGAAPRIYLASQRPLARRAFSCAHELGHHVFKHGSSIDELKDRAMPFSWQDPNEFLADTFAGHLLMPTLGLRRAFAARDWSPPTSSPEQIYIIACDFGVGYNTLLTHLSIGAGMISSSYASQLRKISPKILRERLLGYPADQPLIVSDGVRLAPTIDIEVGSRLLVPLACTTTGAGLQLTDQLPDKRLFEAVTTGIFRIQCGDGWSAFVRVSRANYEGLARYRHLEEVDDDED
jgi:Zn-dependent peptidase ImmA (M78 family)